MGIEHDVRSARHRGGATGCYASPRRTKTVLKEWRFNGFTWRRRLTAGGRESKVRGPLRENGKEAFPSSLASNGLSMLLEGFLKRE